MNHRTKIIATIGPASNSESILRELIEKGVSLIRLNFSFGTLQSHKEIIRKIRKISDELERPIAIIQDLRGPKLRVKKLFEEKLVLTPGQSITIIDDDKVDKDSFSVTYPEFWKYVAKGSKILLSDGLIELEISEIEEGKIHCKVIHGGVLIEGKGLNIPSPTLRIPSITEKDRVDLEFGLTNGVDFIALSFVQSEKEILELRSIITNAKKNIQIIAKIEKPEAIENITAILQSTDAIMVARGDLAIEMPLERVPSLQQKLIQLGHLHQKPVIIATQMLYTMEFSPRPSRAEVSDVAHAIHEGTDAVMLSGETAIGKYPVETVQTLVRIIEEAEKIPFHLKREESPITSIYRIPSGVSYTACQLASILQAKAILTFTASGFTALAISKQRPSTPIIALTPYKEVQRRCNLYWGVKAMVVGNIDSTDKMFTACEKIALVEKLAKPGDILIITAGIPFGIKGTTNLIKVHTIGKNAANDGSR
ncbi:MAG: pyruvate kinase [Candidatus Helarchaeota archaeon]